MPACMHPLKPSEYRVQELQEAFEEGGLAQNG
jgi:hypothetical protein